MKLSLKKGTTSKILHIFIQDSSSTTGAGLTGLVFNSASLAAYYIRPGDASATAITLATATVGTWATGGFKEVSSANMPGVYEFDIPDACLATGANQVVVMLKGATNMAPLLLEIQLTDIDLNDSVRMGMTALPNAAAGATNGLPLSVDSSGRVDVLKINGTSQTARDIGASVLLSAGSGTGQLDFTNGVVKSNLAQILGTALTETAGQIAAAFKQWFNVATPTGTVNSIPNAVAGASGGLLIAGSNAATTVNITGNITGNLSGSVGSVTGAVGSVTGAVGSVTGNVGGNVVGSVASVTAGVTVTTNNDKTGYTASTVTDKTGYSLTNTEENNIAAKILATPANLLATDASGRVTVGSNADKTGYSLTQSFPTNFALLSIDGNGKVALQSPTNIKKNVALSNFMFLMTDSTNHQPATGLTVSVQLSKDGAAFAGSTNSVTEVGNGWYKINFTQAEMNADFVALRMTATGADTLNISFPTNT